MQNLKRFIIGDVTAVAQTATPVTDEAHTVIQDRWIQLGVSTTSPTGARNVSSVTVTDPTENITYTIDVDYSMSTADATQGRIYIIPTTGKIKSATDGTWEASTTYAVGDLVIPTTPNNRFYYATTAGDSDVGEPTWPTDESTVVDNEVTWQDMGLIASNLGVVWVNYTPAANTRDQLRSAALATVTGQLRFISNAAKGANRNLLGTKVTLAPSGDLVFKADDPAYVEINWDISFAEPDTGAALYIDDVPV